ncbi:unnamed protein product [Rhodiola kirilowii]
MHVEKNICESLLGTLLNISGKTKDGVKARLDILEMNIRTKLAPEPRGHIYICRHRALLSLRARKLVCADVCGELKFHMGSLQILPAWVQ